jgi:cytochrome P450
MVCQTVVEMSSHFVHRNARVFEDPNEFVPERWLGADGRNLDRWLVSFSRGPRSCLGLKYAIILKLSKSMSLTHH